MGIFDLFRRKKRPLIGSVYLKEVKTDSVKEGSIQIFQKEINEETIIDLQNRFLAFDVETTGLNPLFDRIVELGVVEFINGIPSRSFNSLVNPGVSIPPAATAVNHITNEMLATAPPEKDIYPSFLSFMGDALRGKTILCAHNARFDIDFICNTLSRLGFDVEISYIDTLALSRRQIRGLKNYKLGTVAEHYKIDCKDAHRAKGDALMCGQILIRLLEDKEVVLLKEKKRIESLTPTNEELEVCAVIQNAIEKTVGDASYLRYFKRGDYVSICCFYTMAKFKFSKKGKYIVVSKEAANICELPTEPCTVSEGGSDLERVYFSNPFMLEPLSGYFSNRYKQCSIELENNIYIDRYYRQQVTEYLRDGKIIKADELEGLLLSAQSRSYEDLEIKIDRRISRDEIVVCAQNNRCPLSEIRNLGNWEAGFKEGSYYYFEGEKKRKDGSLEEAIKYFDLARYNGYEAPALYNSYAKAYRQLKDYENEIVILEEFLSRNTYGHDSQCKSRLESAIKLLYRKQEAEKKTAEKKELKEKKQKNRENQLLDFKPKGRPVLQLSDDGTIIRKYDSITAAVKESGINSKSIRDAANGVQKHAGGYCWKFDDQ